MRYFAVLGCLAVFACSISAAPLPEPAQPVPGPHAAPPARLTDRDGDRISDGLQAAIASARPGDLFRVIVTFSAPGNSAAARQAVGFFNVHREFRIINGFSATMTAAQVRGLARQAGVFRIEDDFAVSVKLDAARPDFGVDLARTSFNLNGTGIRGCIVDTGVDPNHEQLSNVVAFFDAVNSATLAYDDQGHGSHVASIAFGDGTGGAGADKYKGVAPGVAIFAAKVLDQNGSGPESQVIAGIDWCVDQGVHIISMSLGSAAASDGSDALSLAANAAVTQHGIVVVAAAGNAGDEPGTVGAPGAATQVITVAACAERSAPAGSPNHSDGIYLAPFSSRGPTLDNRIKPDVCAPGHSITAAKAGTVDSYITYSGTSMATPFVAGAIALALEAQAMTPAQVRQKLDETAQDRGPAGKDNDFGAGLIDAYAFVARTKGVTGYAPTAFPSYERVSASVATHGLWSYPFTIGQADLGTPIGATITINGEAKCTLPLFGICFSAQWDPDLEARLLDPNGVVLSDSTCLADTECGGIGRQETLHAMPTVAGSYTIQVYPAEDSGNQGKGGSFFLDLSRGPLGGGAPNPNPDPYPNPNFTVHVGVLGSSTTSTKTGWKTSITITLHDADHNTFTSSAATVSGTWSGGYSGNSSCTTTTGQCSVTTGNISKRKGSVTFTITNVSGAGLTPGSNDVTSITVNKP